MVEKKGISKKKVFVLPNSIPTKEYTNLNKKRHYDLITLGRLSPEKGLFILLNIDKELKKIIHDIKLAIACKGYLFRDIKLKIDVLLLNENVDLLGFVDSIHNFLNSGKLFITASRAKSLP